MEIGNRLKVMICLLMTVVFQSSASGNQIRKDLDLTSVKRIKLMGDVNVRCILDSTGTSGIEYPDSATDWKDRLFLTVDSEILTIQTTGSSILKKMEGEQDTCSLIVRVSPDLDGLENGYGSMLEVIGGVSTNHLQVKLSGNGVIKIDSLVSPKTKLSIITGNGLIDIGKIQSEEVACNILGTGTITIQQGFCELLKCKTMGTGKMDLTGLSAKKVRIKYSGGGSVDCCAMETLSIEGMGTTKIGYIGNPRINLKGNVRPQQKDE